MCAVGPIHVAKPPAALVLLHLEVEHRLLLAVVDACDARQVRLAVVGFHLLHDVGWQVLEDEFLVVVEKLLAIDENLLHLLAVVGNLAIVVDDDARQLLEQLLNHGAGGKREGGGVIYHGVLNDGHLRQQTCDDSLLHERGILAQEDVLHLLVAATPLEVEGKRLRLVAHEAHLQRVAPGGHTRQHELPVGRRLPTRHKAARGVVELHGGSRQAVERLRVIDRAAHVVPRHLRAG